MSGDALESTIEAPKRRKEFEMDFLWTNQQLHLAENRRSGWLGFLRTRPGLRSKIWQLLEQDVWSRPQEQKNFKASLISTTSAHPGAGF